MNSLDGPISPPAKAALDKRNAAVDRAARRLDAFQTKYTALVRALSDTEFRGLLVAVSKEAIVRSPDSDPNSKAWIEQLIAENGG